MMTKLDPQLWSFSRCLSDNIININNNPTNHNIVLFTLCMFVLSRCLLLLLLHAAARDDVTADCM